MSARFHCIVDNAAHGMVVRRTGRTVSLASLQVHLQVATTPAFLVGKGEQQEAAHVVNKFTTDVR